MKEKFKQAFMDTARRFAELSHARRLKVGAIVVNDDRIISIGYNGMPAGWDNNCEEHPKIVNQQTYAIEEDKTRLVTRQEVLHAERNALDKLARNGGGGSGSYMFSTHSPCLECAKSIYGAGITEFFYSEDYRSTDGIDFLKNCGVKIEKISTDDK